MNQIPESIFLVSSIIGLLISLALISQVFSSNKAGFFIGLVVMILSFELLFSWGAASGYNNAPGAFQIWRLLNYHIIAPSIWLFSKFTTDDNFRLKSWHYLLFIPALIDTSIPLLTSPLSVSLSDYPIWIWYTEYLSLLTFTFSLLLFWISYYKLDYHRAFKNGKRGKLSQLRLLTLMGCLTALCILAIVFSFIGWRYFYLIELTLIFLFFGLAFITFLESPAFPSITPPGSNEEFPNYSDNNELKRLELLLENEKLFLKPNLPLKELAAELKLPYRYVSYLINNYHNKNYKEFINGYRIDTFLKKARSEEKQQKTLLGLAMESGFSSKSTFNQVFKSHLGKTPSEYLS